jgi:hypothetical protein
MTTMTTIRTLDELLAVLQAAPQDHNDGAQVEYARTHGLPVAHGVIDFGSLPSFGGAEPADTFGVWSWDETRLLIGSCSDDFRIVAR